MTIFEGTDGSINLFWNDLFISSFALSKLKTLESYYDEGNHILLEALRDGVSIDKVKFMFRYFCRGMYKRKKNKLPIYRTDHILFMCTIFALIKLKDVDIDDVLLIMPKKKKRKQ